VIMNGKKSVIAIIASGALAALALSSCGSMKEMEEKAKGIDSIVVADIDFSKLADGTYEDFQDFGLDTAKVSVTVAGGKVTDIRVLQHQHGPGKKHSGEPVAKRVLDAQSLRVDVVSGATGSSKVILKAIETALAKGRAANP